MDFSSTKLFNTLLVMLCLFLSPLAFNVNNQSDHLANKTNVSEQKEKTKKPKKPKGTPHRGAGRREET